MADCQKKLAKAEERLLEAPDDMMAALYAQIRMLRETQQQAQAELTAAGRVGDISERAIADETKQIVSDLRRLRGEIRSVSPATARAALLTIIDGVELFTAPVKPYPGMPNNMRRRLARIRIHYNFKGKRAVDHRAEEALICTLKRTA